MPFELQLPRNLKADGWKVKIFDKEELEPPHVTVLRGQMAPGPERLPIFDSTWWILGRFSQKTSTTA